MGQRRGNRKKELPQEECNWIEVWGRFGINSRVSYLERVSKTFMNAENGVWGRRDTRNNCWIHGLPSWMDSGEFVVKRRPKRTRFGQSWAGISQICYWTCCFWSIQVVKPRRQLKIWESGFGEAKWKYFK